MPISSDEFVGRMSRHWSETLGNVESLNLQAVWQQMADTFNLQIELAGSPDAKRWRVLQPPTGTGKTQGLALYCALLHEVCRESEHPGVVIVTRRIEQADELVETINRLAGDLEVAVVDHSENRASQETLFQAEVIVITHNAYTGSIESSRFGWPSRKWEALSDWKYGSRKLVVIDEALDIVKQAQVSAKDVGYVLRAIPDDVWYCFKRQRHALEVLEFGLQQIAEDRSQPGLAKEEMLWTAELPIDEYEFDKVRFKLKDIPFDKHFLLKEDPIEREYVRKRVDKILYQVNIILNSWHWYSRNQYDHTLNSAFSLVPPLREGAVIMDATASPNLIYRLIDEAEVIPVPAQARRYDNVLLHYSMDHAVGKSSVLKKPAEYAMALVESLKQQFIYQDKSVLFCCHQGLETHLIGLKDDSGFRRYDVGHWQALDGRNDWKDFDTVVIPSLPYLPAEWSANLFMSLQGVRNSYWLRAPQARQFDEHEDIRKALGIGHLTVSIVQAINRVHCRKVVDAQGNCLPTDVFLLLPSGNVGESILTNILTQMPGINLVEWNFEVSKRKARKSNHEEVLCRYAAMMPAGRLPAFKAREELEIPIKTWEWLSKKLRNPDSELAKRLADSGVCYEVIRERNTQRAYLYKA